MSQLTSPEGPKVIYIDNTPQGVLYTTPVKGYNPSHTAFLTPEQHGIVDNWKSPLKFNNTSEDEDVPVHIADLRERINLGRHAAEQILLKQFQIANMTAPPMYKVRDYYGSEFDKYLEYTKELYALADEFEEDGSQYPMEEAYMRFLAKYKDDNINSGNLEFAATYFASAGYFDQDLDAVKLETPEHSRFPSIYPMLPEAPKDEEIFRQPVFEDVVEYPSEYPELPLSPDSLVTEQKPLEMLYGEKSKIIREMKLLEERKRDPAYIASQKERDALIEDAIADYDYDPDSFDYVKYGSVIDFIPALQADIDKSEANRKARELAKRQKNFEATIAAAEEWCTLEGEKSNSLFQRFKDETQD